jgi:choline dehydrogenase
VTREIETDIVVVGAGSSGCIVAARVSEAAGLDVVLVEAGGPTEGPWFTIPAGFAKLLAAGKVYWKYQTEPEAGLDGRQVNWPRGKVVGGSGAINGMVYLRGAPIDYEHWVEAGAVGWSWQDCLPYYRRLEAWEGAPGRSRGQGGPIPITHPTQLSTGAKLFIEACKNAGFKPHQDVNDGEIEGVSAVQANIRNGRRVTSSTAYLEPALKRDNFHLLTHTLTQRIEFKDGRAVGILAKDARTGEEIRIKARREVVLCTGAIGTPQLLMVSGIGDREALERLNIPVVAHSPEVGCNLQDHMSIRLRYASKEMDTLNEAMRSPLTTAWMGMWYLITRAGPLANGPTEALYFAKTAGGYREANMQTQYINFCTGLTHTYQLPKHAGFMMNLSQCRPVSRGTIRIRSRNFEDPPIIQANYLSDPSDVREAIEGIRQALKVAETEPLRSAISENLSGLTPTSSDEEIHRYIRGIASTVYHPCGTARMGSDPLSVTDPRLLVRGVKGLRIADASVMPTITSGNIHAPVLMIGERASDFIKADHPVAQPAHSHHY